MGNICQKRIYHSRYCCFKCNKITNSVYYVNGLYYCNINDFSVEFSKIEEKYTDINDYPYNFYDNCKICSYKIKSKRGIRTFHHCSIPINNKYMNVNIL